MWAISYFGALRPDKARSKGKRDLAIDADNYVALMGEREKALTAVTYINHCFLSFLFCSFFFH